MLVGVIADTHGLLRPEVFSAFDGVEHILHAGDVEDPGILTDLEAVAPVSAVHGNVDGPDVRAVAPATVELELAGIRVAVTHGHLAPDRRKLPRLFPDARVIVYGHSHLPRCDRIGATLLLNPGSAGPRRFGRPVTVALLRLAANGARVRHLDLLARCAEYPAPGVHDRR